MGGETPILQLDSTVVDAGVVGIGETRSAGLLGRNGSLVDMALSWSIQGAGFALSVPPTAASIAPGEEFEIALKFTGIQPGDAIGQLTLTSDDPDRPSVDVALSALTLLPLGPDLGPAPQVNAGGVVLATGTPVVTDISPSSIITLFGQEFATSGTLALQPELDSGGRVSTTLADTCVEINGVRSTMFAVLPTQINLQVDESISPGTAYIVVVRGCGTATEQRSAPQAVIVTAVSPAFFNFVNNADGENPIAALHGGGPDLIGAAGSLTGVVTTPAQPGEFVSLFATGFGPTDPLFEAGEIPGAAAPVTGQVSATVAGIALSTSDILYVGVAPCCTGLYELVLKVPENAPDGNLPVTVVINGVSTPPGPFIAVEGP